MQDSTMLSPVSGGITGHPYPWKGSGPTLGGMTLRPCIALPGFVATVLRGRQFCRWSSSSPVLKPLSEMGQSEGKSEGKFEGQSEAESEAQTEAQSEGQSEQKVDSKVSKRTIYDSLQKERITMELFPELNFTLAGNFYPKLVRLLAQKINTLLEEAVGEERVPELLQLLGLKLNPHLVAEVLKLRKDPSKADHFFKWAGNQPDFQHNSHTYNLMFWNLVKKKKDMPGNYLVDSLIFLEEMILKDLTPGRRACNVLIDRVCKDNKVAVALQLTKVLERKDFPDLVTYNSLINGLGISGLFNESFGLLEEMKKKGCMPDIVTYNSLINGLSKAGLFKKVFEMLDEMVQRGCTPDRVTYNSIIYGLGNAGRWQEAYKIFDEFPGKEIVPDVVTYNSLIVALFKCRQPDEACKVYGLMGPRGCKPDRITYNTLIDGHFKSTQVDKAWKIFHSMDEEGVSPDEVTYNTMIGGLVKNYCLVEASTLFRVMKEKGCKPDAITHRMLGSFGEGLYSGGMESSASVTERDLTHENENGSTISGFGEFNEQEMQVLL